MAEKTLREHLSEAGRKRWVNMTQEQRTAHVQMMNAQRWPNGKGNKNKKSKEGATLSTSELASTGEKENPKPEA